MGTGSAIAPATTGLAKAAPRFVYANNPAILHSKGCEGA
jgi:hypothetical protein